MLERRLFGFCERKNTFRASFYFLIAIRIAFTKLDVYMLLGDELILENII